MAINNWTKAIFEGRAITIYGDGNQTRDFTYVEDIIDGTIKAAETNGVEGEIFNLGAGSRISVNEVVRILIDVSGIGSIQIIYQQPKLGDVRDTHANISKASKMLGFRPKTRIKEGLEKFILWYKKNRLKI